jgi:hypothetical protein
MSGSGKCSVISLTGFCAAILALAVPFTGASAQDVDRNKTARKPCRFSFT